MESLETTHQSQLMQFPHRKTGFSKGSFCFNDNFPKTWSLVEEFLNLFAVVGEFSTQTCLNTRFVTRACEFLGCIDKRWSIVTLAVLVQNFWITLTHSKVALNHSESTLNSELKVSRSENFAAIHCFYPSTVLEKKRLWDCRY